MATYDPSSCNLNYGDPFCWIFESFEAFSTNSVDSDCPKSRINIKRNWGEAIDHGGYFAGPIIIYRNC